MKKVFFINLFFCLCFTSCKMNEFTFKTNLSSNFYLAESEMLPSKYICLKKKGHYLVLLYDIFSIKGNKNEAIIMVFCKKNEYKYYRIKYSKVEYPEDIEEIDRNKYFILENEIVIRYEYDFSKDYENG